MGELGRFGAWVSSNLSDGIIMIKRDFLHSLSTLQTKDKGRCEAARCRRRV